MECVNDASSLRQPPQGSGSALLQAALEYRERGLATLPLRGKKPASELIFKTHGTRSTVALAGRGSDEDQLRFWFSHQDINVGIFCGEPSGGLVVVDLDECDFPPTGARFPLTPMVKTGRGTERGYHLYFRTEADVSNKNLSYGEVRAVAPHYVVAPPSRHPTTGLTYEWELPLTQHPLADFSDVVLPLNDTPISTNNHIRPTRDFLLRPVPTRDKKKGRWLQRFDADPQAVQAMARVLGIDAELGLPFPCVIHPERNPSASLHQATSGEWLYHDFHAKKHAGKDWLTLAQVRALQADRAVHLSGSEHATWKLLLLGEAGVLPPLQVPTYPLPPEIAGFIHHVYERFLFLLGCRWNYDYGQPLPFDRRFASAVADVPERLAREAIDELARLKAIHVAGRAGRTRLWLPQGYEPPAPTQHEQAPAS